MPVKDRRPQLMSGATRMQWKQMGSEPHDGTRFLLYSQKWGVVVATRKAGWSGWFVSPGQVSIRSASGWMELPEPPAADAVDPAITK